MDGDIKIRIGADTKPLENAVKKSVKELKKDIDGLGDAILTDQEIERQVKEREKILRKSIKDSKKRGIAPADETEEELFKYYNTQKVSSVGGKMWDRFYDTVGKQWLEPPAQLQGILKQRQEEQLRRIEKENEKEITEEIQHIEENITEEYKKQKDVAEQTDEERKENSNKFFDTIKKGGSNLANLFGNVGKSVAMIGKVAIVGTAVKVLMNLLEKGVYAIAGLLGNILTKIKETNSEVYSKVQVIKAMIDSIAETITPILTVVLKTAMDGIIQAMKFVQHTVFALTGVDIFKFTGDKLAENMKQTAKSAKEASKQLMGFDEANILKEETQAGATNTAFDNAIAQEVVLDLNIDENYFEKVKEKIISAVSGVFETLSFYANNPSELLKIFGPFSGIIQGIIDVFLDVKNVILDVIGIFDGWKDIIVGFFTNDWDLMFQGVGKVWENTWNLIKDVFITVFDFITYPIKVAVGHFSYWIKKGYETIKSFLMYIWDKFNEFIKPILEWLGDRIEDIKGIIDNVKEKVSDAFTFIKTKFDEGIGKTIQWIVDRINDIKKFFSEHFGTTFEINADTSQAEEKADNLIQKILTAGVAGGGTTAVQTIASKVKSTFGKLKSALHLDGGGIVLPVPGHGVPIGNAVMSERRAEGIIPLENPTAMEKLGEAIGKYVNIAIDNRMVVDGRVLASATNNRIDKERFLMNR